MKILVLLLPFMAACSSSYMQPSTPGGAPGPDEAKVVFSRPSSALGGGATFPVWDQTKLLGFSESGGYFEYRCKPGPHFFIVSAQTYKGVSAELSGGLVYYVWLTSRVGFLSAAVGLTPVPKGSELMKDVEASLKDTECRVLVPEKGAKYEAKHKETLADVLKEFRSKEREAEPPLKPEDGVKQP